MKSLVDGPAHGASTSGVSLCHGKARHVVNDVLAVQVGLTHVASHISLASAGLTAISSLGAGN